MRQAACALNLRAMRRLTGEATESFACFERNSRLSPSVRASQQTYLEYMIINALQSLFGRVAPALAQPPEQQGSLARAQAAAEEASRQATTSGRNESPDGAAAGQRRADPFDAAPRARYLSWEVGVDASQSISSPAPAISCLMGAGVLHGRQLTQTSSSWHTFDIPAEIVWLCCSGILECKEVEGPQ